MAAYVIFNYLQVFDEEKILAYRKQAHPTVAEYGGSVVIRPGPLEVKEGREVAYMIVTEWPDMDAANAWYHSPEYQLARKIREDAADVQVIIAQGA
tara:strand:+ start:120386 stop:120673 length:288 start_codon:yes stop_codon:yes gene_type:complete